MLLAFHVSYCWLMTNFKANRPFSYSKKEFGLSDIFYIFIRKVLLSGVKASGTIVHLRKFDKIYTNIVRFRIAFLG